MSTSPKTTAARSIDELIVTVAMVARPIYGAFPVQFYGVIQLTIVGFFHC